MSYEVKWVVPFKSIAAVEYRVQVLVEGYSGDPIRLRAADNPLSTSEDESEEYFKPIRTQTGYLRILDNGYDLDGNAFDWSELLPANNLSHQVRLQRYNPGATTPWATQWVGYMQAAMYTTSAFQGVTQYEFPVTCPLGVLASIPFQFNNTNGTLLTVGQVLYMALSATGVAWGDVKVSRNVNGHNDLNARFSLMNFTTEDAKNVNTSTAAAEWESSSTMSEVVEEICKFFGWTMFSRGTTIFLVAVGTTTKFRQYTFASLANVIGSVGFYNGDEYSLTALSYKSAEHTMDYILGAHDVEVESDVGEDATALAPAFQDLTYDWYGGAGHVVSYGDEYDSVQFYLSNNTQGYRVLHNDLIYYIPGSDPRIMLAMDDTWPKDSEKTSFSLRNDLLVGPNGGTLRLRSLQSICLPTGSMLSITANVRYSLDPRVTYDFDPEVDFVKMSIKIGNYYWTGSTWSTSYQDLTAYISKGGRLLTTKPLYNPHNGAAGFCVGMTRPLYGQLEVTILSEAHEKYILDTLQVKVFQEDDMVQPTAKAQRTWTRTANAQFRGKQSISLAFATGSNMKYGKGQLYNQDGSNLTTIPYLRADGTTVDNDVPESRLCARMAEAYGQRRERLHIDVERATIHAAPDAHFLFNGDRYLPQCVSNEWAEDTMRLTLIRY